MRGIAEATLVALILAIAAGLVLGGITTVFVMKGKVAVNKEACRANVFGAAKSADLFPLTNCYTENKDALAYSGQEENYQREVSSQVATMLSDCKYQFAEAPHLPYKGDWVPKGSVCFVCSTFQLPKDAPQGAQGKIVLSSFQTWLKNNQRGQQTYAEYLVLAVPFKDLNYLFLNYLSVENVGIFSGTIDVIKKAFNIAFQASEYDIALIPATNYAVLHYGLPQTKGSYIAEFFGLDTSKAAGGNNGVNTLGDTTFTTGEIGSVFIMPFDNIAKTCEVTMVRYP